MGLELINNFHVFNGLFPPVDTFFISYRIFDKNGSAFVTKCEILFARIAEIQCVPYSHNINN